MSHTVTHLQSGKSFTRPKLLVNTLQHPRDWSQSTDPSIEAFHRTLPNYAETQLHSLPDVAAELGFSHVFVKDESTRFGLPAFKILGASWAIHQSICQRLALPDTTALDDVIRALQGRDDVRLVTCTEGNWGRACARMAKHLGIPCKIYVPYFMNADTQDLLREEGATVAVLADGSYDDTIVAVRAEAARDARALMVMDTSWEGFDECPRWVTDGYSTMLAETTRQVAAQADGRSATLALAAVGVGSWAHAVVSYYGAASRPSLVVAVEPTAAPSFKESLHRGEITPIRTGETIMNGMNCGTTSLIAWPEMRDGVFAAVTVEDVEAHREVKYLRGRGVNAGPCGAATLAALKTLCADRDVDLGERAEQVVVLFSTEGNREYEVPN